MVILIIDEYLPICKLQVPLIQGISRTGIDGRNDEQSVLVVISIGLYTVTISKNRGM